MQSLYDDPELYDLVAPADAAMERFYVEAAGGPGRRVLELACGSGRFTVPLAASGALVIGGDLSKPMLARARAAAAERGVSAEFVTLDMRDFVLGRRFDAIVIAANSLMHLHDRDDFAAPSPPSASTSLPAAGCCSTCSSPACACSVCRRGSASCSAASSMRSWARSVSRRRSEPISQVMRTDWYWSTAERKDFRHTPLELRQIFPQELPLLLEAGGLRLVERFGDFDRSPLTAASHRQVCVSVAA